MAIGTWSSGNRRARKLEHVPWNSPRPDHAGAGGDRHSHGASGGIRARRRRNGILAHAHRGQQLQKFAQAELARRIGFQKIEDAGPLLQHFGLVTRSIGCDLRQRRLLRRLLRLLRQPLEILPGRGRGKLHMTPEQLLDGDGLVGRKRGSHGAAGRAQDHRCSRAHAEEARGALDQTGMVLRQDGEIIAGRIGHVLRQRELDVTLRASERRRHVHELAVLGDGREVELVLLHQFDFRGRHHVDRVERSAVHGRLRGDAESGAEPVP